MKIRNGFVSNSSSSSFIVAIPEDVMTQDQLQKCLMGTASEYPNPYPFDREPDTWPAELVTSIVFQDMFAAGLASRDSMIREYGNGWTDAHMKGEQEARAEFNLGEWDIPDNDDVRRKYYDRYQELVDKHSAKAIDEFVAQNPDCSFFIVEYSDNDGQLSCAMEHGSLFDRVPHLRVSKH